MPKSAAEIAKYLNRTDSANVLYALRKLEKAGLLEMVQMKYIDGDGLPHREKPWWYRYGADLERAADAFLQFEFSGGIAAKLRNARGAMKTFFRDHGL